MGIRHEQERRYERETLYEEVWQAPVMVVAKRYGISDVMLKKICKRLNVPTPPLGYWAKLYAGKPVERLPLPHTKGPKIFTGYVHEPKMEKSAPPLAFLDESTRQSVLTACNTISIHRQLTYTHPLITQDQKARIRERERREESHRALITVFGNDDISTSEVPIRGVLDLNVPEALINRAYGILEAIFHTVEYLDGKIHTDFEHHKTAILLFDQSVRIRMTGKDGQLVVAILEYPSLRKTWRDTPHRRLEQQVGQFLIAVFECAHRLQAMHENHISMARHRQQEEQQRQERLRQQQDEQSRFDALERTAQDWQRARIIEAYVAELVQHVEEATQQKERQAMEDYITWAKAKIAWLDPLVKREDPFLGLRPGDM